MPDWVLALRELQGLVLGGLGIVAFTSLAVLFRQPISGFIRRLTKVDISRENQGRSTAVALEAAEAREPQLATSLLPPPASSEVPASQNVGPPAVGGSLDDAVEHLYGQFSTGAISDAQRYYESQRDGLRDRRHLLTLESFYLFYRFTFGLDPSLDLLKNLLERCDDAATRKVVLRHLSLASQKFGRFAEASEYLRAAAALEEDWPAKMDLLSEAARNTAKAGDLTLAAQSLLSAIKECPTPPARAMGYQALADLFRDAGLPAFERMSLLLAIDLTPNDTELLFRLGYLIETPLAQQRLYSAALRIAADMPHALNNLGVAYSRLGLKGLAMEQFGLARAKGYTLAASNLANSLMRAGHWSLAKEQLEWAKGQDSPDPEVWRSLTSLEEKIREQSSALEKIETGADAFAEFLLRMSRQAFGGPPLDHSALLGDWTLVDNTTSGVTIGPASTAPRLGTTLGVSLHRSLSYAGDVEFLNGAAYATLACTEDTLLLRGAKINVYFLYDGDKDVLHAVETGDNDKLDWSRFVRMR